MKNELLALDAAADAEFLDLVARMRAAQKGYFRERSPRHLEDSKRLEREVDRAIARERGPKAEPSLFDREPNP